VTFEFDPEAIGRVYEVLDAELSPIEIPESLLDPVRERFYEPQGCVREDSFRAT
jgi:hypothetical protein